MSGWSVSDSRRVWGLLLALWLLYSLVLGGLYILLPPSPDQALYDYIGWVMVKGGALYRDAADHNFPGVMLLHAASTALFGNTLWSYRVLDYLLMLPCALAMGALVARSAGPVAGGLTPPIYQAVYVTSGYWFAGQRDVVGADWLVAAVLCFLRALRNDSRAWLAAYAALCLGAVLIRPTFLLLPALVVAADLALRGETGRSLATVVRAHCLVAAWMLTALGLLALAAWPSGALTEWFHTAVLFNMGAYTDDGRGFSDVLWSFWAEIRESLHWISAFGVLGLGWWALRRPRAPFALTLALLVTGVVSALVQRKGFGYHLGSVLPALCMGVAVFVGSLWDRAAAVPGWNLRRLLLLGACGVVSVGLAGKLVLTFYGQLHWLAGLTPFERTLEIYNAGDEGLSVADVVAAAEWVERESAPDATVLVWGRPIYVNYLAARRSPIRFGAHLLPVVREPFPLASAWHDELSEVLAHAPPALFLLPLPLGTSPLAPAAAFGDTRPEREMQAALAERYRYRRRFGTLAVYGLRP